MLVDRSSNGNAKGMGEGRILNRKGLQQGISSAPLPQRTKSSLRFSNSDLKIHSTAFGGVRGKNGYKMTNLKHTGGCTSLESRTCHCLMQKRCSATLFLITTYSIKILHQSKAAGYKRCSLAALTPLSFSTTCTLEEGSKL